MEVTPVEALIAPMAGLAVVVDPRVGALLAAAAAGSRQPAPQLKTLKLLEVVLRQMPSLVAIPPVPGCTMFLVQQW